jgi:hypothetical protein
MAALRDRVNLFTAYTSDTLYVKGIPRTMREDSVAILLANTDDPVEIDTSMRCRFGEIWVKYGTAEAARRSITCLHHKRINGSSLCVRYELGNDESGKRKVDKLSHNTIIRCVEAHQGCGDVVNLRDVHSRATYNCESVMIDRIVFPFPSGMYLARLLFLTRSVSPTDPLLRMLTDPCLANKYAKEITEAMAMVDSLDRSVKHVMGVPTAELQDVVVYVLGDGRRPLCAAAICLHFPPTWRFHSIDPILEVSDVGEYGKRFSMHPVTSQEFVIASPEKIPELSIVVACHSHAPLAEFWHRVPAPKVCVSMPCCADYSDIPGAIPLISFDDFEVYSPKRHIFIYAEM